MKVRFSPDGKLVATISLGDRDVQIWSASDGHPVTPAIPANADGFVFSANGNHLLCNGQAGAQLFDARTGSIAGAIIPQSRALGLSEDGKFVICASGGGLRIWNSQSAEPVTPLMTHLPVWAAGFSRDNEYIVTCGEDTRIWDTHIGRGITLTIEHDAPDSMSAVRGQIGHASFSSNGKYILTTGYDARIWDASDGKLIWNIPHAEKISCRALFAPKRDYVLVLSDSNSVQLWNFVDRIPIAQRMSHSREVIDFAFSPDGKYIVTASADNTVRVWDASAANEIAPAKSFGSIVKRVAFSPNGKFILTTGENVAQVWNPWSGAESSINHKPLGGASFNEDSTSVLTFTDRGFRVWDLRDNKPVTPLLFDENKITTAIFSPDGMKVAVGSFDSARVWDIASARPLTAAMKIGTGFLEKLAFSPDGKYLVTACWEKAARVWEASSGKPVSPPLEHANNVMYAEFAPDGQYVITAGHDNRVHVWSIGPCRYTIRQCELLARLFSSRRIDATGGIVQLNENEWNEVRNTLRTEMPDLFRPGGYRGGFAFNKDTAAPASAVPNTTSKSITHFWFEADNDTPPGRREWVEKSDHWEERREDGYVTEFKLIHVVREGQYERPLLLRTWDVNQLEVLLPPPVEGAFIEFRRTGEIEWHRYRPIHLFQEPTTRP